VKRGERNLQKLKDTVMLLRDSAIYGTFHIWKAMCEAEVASSVCGGIIKKSKKLSVV